ncbi:N-acetylneuraminate lyase [Puteibacter caeruleilacunae]|nr:N-acetylneuraminate lyase [Puteibacter caeruleilacunae]
MCKLNVDGLIAAPFTPMNEDGSLNLSVVEKYAAKLKADGLAGVFICGTTGEGMLMTDAERKLVAEEWLKYRSDDFKVIVHVGSTSYVSAAELAAHAQERGADAVGSMGPVFLPPSDVDSLVDYCKHIAAACENIPFYYYHMPATSNVRVSMKEFLLKADPVIPNLAGIKFTHFDLMEMQQCQAVCDGKFEIMHGYDEILLCGLSLGAKAAVGSTYNYLASVYQDIRNAYSEGNISLAQSLQAYSVKVVEVLIQFGGGVRAGKEILNLIGIPCGPCRIPIKPFTKEESFRLRLALEEIDFFS